MDDPVKAPWRPAEAIVVVFLAALATAVVSALLLVVIRSEGTAFILGGLTYELSLATFSILWVRMLHRDALPALGLRSTRVLRDVGIGLAAGVAIFATVVLAVAPLVYLLLSTLAGEPVTPPSQEVLPPDPDALQVALQGFVVVVAAPVGEEIFFRGFLHGSLRARFGFAASAGVSGAVFAVFHLIPLLMPLFFAVGVGLAWVYERRRSLVACIAAHAAFNVIGYAYIVRGL